MFVATGKTALIVVPDRYQGTMQESALLCFLDEYTKTKNKKNNLCQHFTN